MKKIFNKEFLKKALPILATTLVALFTAIADQKDSEKMEEMENKIKELEEKMGE